MSRNKWHDGHPILVPAERNEAFAATTLPGIVTQPLPAIDIAKIKTQPVPKIKKCHPGGQKAAKKRAPREMFWWSLLFIAAGYMALFWAQSVIGWVVCEWIGVACSGLWMIDVLIIHVLFRE